MVSASGRTSGKYKAVPAKSKNKIVAVKKAEAIKIVRALANRKGRPDSGGVHPDPMPVCRVRSKKKISLPTRQPLGQGKNPEYDMEKGNDDACQQREIQPLASKTALQLKT